ncbi:sensor histidine kinase [uncultured Bartonella sp.]|uniref:sensor histidine kinase n=1 Tax=uncultured Bartonella sp. TaxID=104108 RepID=UPI002620125E|nr:sensor histidine kinase [uncultured Bartonella sp.]
MVTEEATAGSGEKADKVKSSRRPSHFRSWRSRGHYLFEQFLFSSLTRRIVILNLAALCVLVAGIMYLNQFRDGLIDAKIDSLRTQGKIIAGAIAASATVDTNSILIDPEKLMELQAGQSITPKPESTENWDFPINPERVAPLLRNVISPETTRARIYDRDANLLLDSMVLYSSGQVLSYNLPPIVEDKPGVFERFRNWLTNTIYGNDIIMDKDQLGGNGAVYPEVVKAMNGILATAQRRNSQGELVVSVAVPVQRYHSVVGVLLLSTAGSDIDNIVRAERLAIFKVFAVVAAVLLVLSLFLAYTIANPLRKLSAAADRVRHGTNKRVEIPDFSDRQDEVGHLSTSIRDMTDALYARIEAIEQFAADVSHELKNPLTSLRSAVETLPLAKTHEARERLFDIIQQDVRRLDRLITDISDASRLDAELARETSNKVDMVAMLESIVRASREVRRNKVSATIELDITPRNGGKKYIVAGHDLRLGQVVSNLIENARSFIPAENGKIKLAMHADGTKLVLTVEDNGPGIRAEKIDRIFERFYTDRPGAESFGKNSGLGLSISRQIIEAHNGTLTAENIYSCTEPNKKLGARFIIVLPLEK